MSMVEVNQTDTFDQWRIKTNEISTNIGDLQSLATAEKSNVVAAVNEIAAGSGQGFAIAMAIALG